MQIMIVDDDPLVSGALKVILEQNTETDDRIVVSEVCTSGREAVGKCKNGSFDAILMDIRMDDMNGLEAAEQILSDNPDAKIIFLTTFLDDEYINKALKVGARGYILKQDCGSLPQVVRSVCGGQMVFAGKVVEKLPDIMNRRESFDYDKYDIGPKEQAVIAYVADGLSNKEIAEKMFLGEGTVRNMVSTILSKLELRDRTQLACFYYQEIR